MTDQTNPEPTSTTTDLEHEAEQVQQAINHRLHDTTDAAIWTDQFLDLFYVLPKQVDLPEDEPAKDWQWGLMVGWFANAIEAGRSAGYEQARRDLLARLPHPGQRAGEIIESIKSVLDAHMENDYDIEPTTDDVANEIFDRLKALYDDQALQDSVKSPDIGPPPYGWDALRSTGLLWLINSAVFHPRGLAFALHAEDADSASDGWKLIAAPAGEPFIFLPRSEEHPEGVPLDEMYQRAEDFIAQVRQTQTGTADVRRPMTMGEVIEAVNEKPFFEQLAEVQKIVDETNRPIEDDEDVEYQGDGWREIDGVDMDEADDE